MLRSVEILTNEASNPEVWLTVRSSFVFGKVNKAKNSDSDAYNQSNAIVEKLRLFAPNHITWSIVPLLLILYRKGVDDKTIVK